MYVWFPFALFSCHSPCAPLVFISVPFMSVSAPLSFPVAFLSCQLPISSPHFLALPCVSPLLPSISRKKRFFQRFRKEDVQKHRVFPDFRQKEAGSPSQQKSRQGESSLGPLFCDTVGDTPPPPPKTYVFDVGRGGLGGGVILYPLVSIRHAEQCWRI